MKPKWFQLAGKLLEEASDVYANNTCNDWTFPPDWTIEEKREIVKAMYAENGNLEEYDPDNLYMSDYWIMGFLGKQLRQYYGN